MTEHTNAMDNIIFLDARPQDVDSLTTIVPRAFFQVSEIMKQLLPDTPAMREWWRAVCEDLIKNPNSHIPIAIDTSTNAVVGALLFEGVRKGEPFGGFLAKHQATEDHQPDVWPMAINEFIEDEKRYIGDRDRFLIGVFGVDHAYQGKGIGTKLLTKACEIADSKGFAIFLETTESKKFYLKLGMGFEIMSDPNGVLVREPGGKKD